MKNKIFATLLALTLALSLTACGKEPAKNDRNDAGSGQNSAYDAVSDPNRDNVALLTKSRNSPRGML